LFTYSPIIQARRIPPKVRLTQSGKCHDANKFKGITIRL
jgi:hypothetical protein